MSEAGRGRRIAFVISEYAYFLSHRLSLAEAAVAEGYAVLVITRVPAGIEVAQVQGIRIVPLAISRGFRNPIRDVMFIFSLARELRRWQPLLVQNVSVKLAVLGSIAARLAAAPGVVNAFTGLGFTFRSRGTVPGILRFFLGAFLLRIARHPGTWSVFQNQGDMDYCLGRGLAVRARTVLIPGSGVDTGRYQPSPEPSGPVTVLFPGRLLWDKGIGDFVEAARQLQSRGLPARFIVAGTPDPENPRSVAAATLARWRGQTPVEWLGQVTDMPGAYAAAHIVCLPSWHEGLPKVLLEAAACARPVVATRIPGCAAAVDEGVSGLLVPVRDPRALADALEKLIVNNELRVKMGQNGRRLVEQRHAVPIINRQFLDLYGRLTGRGGKQEGEAQ